MEEFQNFLVKLNKANFIFLDMYEKYFSDEYIKRFKKLSNFEQRIVEKIEDRIVLEPYGCKPLNYKFFREKKFDGKRVLYLIYEDHKKVLLTSITNKKLQQKEIDKAKFYLEIYRKIIGSNP